MPHPSLRMKTDRRDTVTPHPLLRIFHRHILRQPHKSMLGHAIHRSERRRSMSGYGRHVDNRQLAVRVRSSGSQVQADGELGKEERSPDTER